MARGGEEEGGGEEGRGEQGGGEQGGGEEGGGEEGGGEEGEGEYRFTFFGTSSYIYTNKPVFGNTLITEPLWCSS